jgi:hypothetical protein
VIKLEVLYSYEWGGYILEQSEYEVNSLKQSRRNILDDRE